MKKRILIKIAKLLGISSMAAFCVVGTSSCDNDDDKCSGFFCESPLPPLLYGPTPESELSSVDHQIEKTIKELDETKKAHEEATQAKDQKRIKETADKIKQLESELENLNSRHDKLCKKSPKWPTCDDEPNLLYGPPNS